MPDAPTPAEAPADPTAETLLTPDAGTLAPPESVDVAPVGAETVSTATVVAETVGEAEAPAVCASCGTARVGPYCHACGEKRLDRHDYAFLHFAEHTVDTFTHLDVKVFKSLWSLVAKPGVMAADVLAGRRVRWAKPFQTFLIANLIFFLGATAIGVSFFDASLDIQLNNPYSALIRPLAETKAAALGQTMEAYKETTTISATRSRRRSSCSWCRSWQACSHCSSGATGATSWSTSRSRRLR